MVLSLGYIFISDKTDQTTVVVHDRQLLDLVFLQYFGCFFQVGRLIGCYQSFAGHHLVDFARMITLKPQVAVGNDTYQLTVIVDNRYTAYVIFFHHVECTATVLRA